MPAFSARAAAGHLRRHHRHVGGLRVGFGEGLFEHEQVLCGADGDQLAVGFGEAEQLGADLIDGPLVELFEVLVRPPAAPPFVILLRGDEGH